MRACLIEGCDRPHMARGWCSMHYQRWQDHGSTDRVYRRWVNPLVCVCAVPDADPGRDFGMCATCKRKPLALMKAAL